ncbi:MAG: transporter [Caulobacter sp.]|nr:transporter [Caulobacter sp.]
MTLPSPSARQAQAAAAAPALDIAQVRLGAKMIRRLVFPLAILCFVNAIDRVNISFAAHAMGGDVGLTPATFGLGVSAFFVAYLLFQHTHAALLRRFGVRRWLLGSVLLWGVAGLLMARVESVGQFLGARFFLGVAEAGFAPGATYFIGRWLPQQVRARAMATILSAIPLSLILAGPLCGWMLGADNPLGWPAWRWMFALQAIPNFLLAVAAYFYFTDNVAQSRWLTDDERALVEATAPASQEAPWRGVVGDPRVWRCAIGWLLVMAGSYALIFWIPQLVRQMNPDGSELRIGLLSALPQVGLMLGMQVNGWLSDRSGERCRHAGLAAGVAGLALLGSGLAPPGWMALFLLALASAGIGGTQSVFWAIPGALGIGGDRVPVKVITFISIFGTAGGIVGPALVGWLRQHTASFVPALLLLSLMLVAASLILAPLRASPTSNKEAHT